MINNLDFPSHSPSASSSSSSTVAPAAAARGGCWQTAFSDTAAKNARRRRMETRRMKLDRDTHADLARDNRVIKDKGCCGTQDVGYPEHSMSLSSENDISAASSCGHRSMVAGATGSISVIGRRREMEDALAVEPGFVTAGGKTYDFYGVYDGHGGSCVAQACRDRLHWFLAKVLEEEAKTEGGEVNWEKIMVEAFRKMDDEVNQNMMVGSIGSTAVVAVVGEEVVVVANCGDSRAILSRGRTILALSSDHKPNRPDELERIESFGGTVIDWDGQRVQGILATSRSIGDQHLKPFVTSCPEVTVSKREEDDKFLILASDGLWDVVPNEMACQAVRKCVEGRARRRQPVAGGEACLVVNETDRTVEAEAAAVLVELAIGRGSGDNISVIAVVLNGSRTWEG